MNVRLAALFATVGLAAVSTIASATIATTRVHPGVHRAFRKQGTVDLIIELTASTEATLRSMKESAFASRTARINTLKQKLEAANEQASMEIESVLSKEVAGLYASYTSYWISNQASIKGATFELLEQLARLDSIALIREERSFPLAKFTEKPIKAASIQEIVDQEWGVKKIGAPSVWADGNIGQGIVVATVDSGVSTTHEALRSNYRAQYGWFDPEHKVAASVDPSGYGTHVMGSIVGSKGIGVAPGAKWITCRGCSVTGCSESQLLGCAQWIMCPTLVDGSNPDCSKAPHVVSSTWASEQGDNWYERIINAWVAAGIVPTFTIGVEGPECGTVGSPGDYDTVISVGAVSANDTLTDFSGKGPAANGQRKPDITAPGDLIRSASIQNDTAYLVASGLGMATAHVAGAVALLLSAKPNLTIEEVKVALYTTTVQTGLGATGYVCGGIPDSVWPNNQYGHGRLDVFNAYAGFRPAA